MKSFSDLKATARQNLRGNWLAAIVIIVLQGIILNCFNVTNRVVSGASSTQAIEDMTEFILSGGGGSIPNIGGLFFAGTVLSFLSFAVTFILGGVMAYGLAAYFLHLARNKPAAIGDLFEGTKKFLNCFLSYLLVAIFSFLWSIPVMVVMCIIVGILVAVMISSGATALSVLLGLLIFIVVVVAIILLSVILARYAFVYFLIKDSQETDALNYIKQSKAMMKGRAWNYILLNLSFIGWHILAVIPCGLGYLWLSPYVYATITEYYLDVLEQEKRNGNIGFVTLIEEPSGDIDSFQGQY